MLEATTDVCEIARDVIDLELQAIAALRSRINEHFRRACELILACPGRIIVTGMGKSGHIASKIAATLASTGTPSFYVHPADASHGDLGMITPADIVLAISYSGETQELMTILPRLNRLNVPLIAMTGQPNSSLARKATIHLDVRVSKEACPMGLAPTASTTAALVMGDALAISLLEARGFSKEDFAGTHPAGSLGKRLLLQVKDLMRTGSAIPRVPASATISMALVEVTRKTLGMTTIENEQGQVIGVFTDGDLRRSLDKGVDIHQCLIVDVMSSGFKSIRTDMLAFDALKFMEQCKITCLLVMNDPHKVLGVIHMHDILQAGLGL